jgi:hypothetical protein
MLTHYFECQCSDYNHVFRFCHDLSDNSVMLEVNINHYLPWYKRVLEAIRYVFKMDRVHGHFDVTIMRPEDMNNLALLVDDYFNYDHDMTKEDAIELLTYLRAQPNYTSLIKGSWICNLQGTEVWVVDTMSVSGQFARCKNLYQVY